MSVVVGSGVAALSAAASCPAASAAQDAPATPAAPAMTHHKRVKPRRHHASTRAGLPRGGYVYEAMVGGELSATNANMACSGPTLRLSAVALYPEGKSATALWDKTPSAWKRRFTIATGSATTITIPRTTEAEDQEASEHGGMIPNSRGLTGTAAASGICAATTPNAAVGSLGEGVARWRLPEPVKSVAALLEQPPASIAVNELVVGFTILPSGAVPFFQPFS